MLKIRLQRVGRIHEPAFRVVLTDSKNSSKSGRFTEILGSYDPRKSIDSIDADRVKHWLSQGAIPTDTVHNLLVTHKIIQGKKINVSAISKKAPAEPVVEAKQEAPVPTPVSTEEASAPVEQAPEPVAEEVIPEIVPEVEVKVEDAPRTESTPEPEANPVKEDGASNEPEEVVL